MHADRFNRFALCIFGVVVLVAGLASLALSVGLFGKPHSHRALFHNFISDYIGAHGTWFWPAAAALGAIVALLCLRWITTLVVSTDRSGDLNLSRNGGAGQTVLRSNALTAAVETEIKTYRGVASAGARTTGDPSAPELVVEVTVLRGADIAGLSERIETEALAHARAATALPEMPVRLNVAVGSKSLSRL